MIRTRGLSSIELPVDDVDEAIRFYADVFGFEVTVRRPGGASMQSPGGGGTVVLTGAAGPITPTRFGLELTDPDDLDPALRLAVSAGGRVVERRSVATGGAVAVVADPFGHLVTLA